MKAIVCENCGSNSFFEKGDVRICKYCNTKFIVTNEKQVYDKSTSFIKTSKCFGPGISLNEDIQILLEKCKNDPSNAKRYANRILDIDPTNREALKILSKQ